MTFNKFELHGTSRFDIYYYCNIYRSIAVKSIHVVIAGICSGVNSILHLHVPKRTL